MLRRLSARQLQSIYRESKERMSPSDRDAWLNRKLRRQVQFAYLRSPAVKSKLDLAGVSPGSIHGLRDLERLPVTTKDELVRMQKEAPPFGGFLTVPLDTMSRVYVSPGPIYDAWGPERSRAQLRAFLRAGLPRPGDVVLVSLAYHMVPAGLCLTDALDLLGCTVVPAGTGQTELQVKLLRDLKATAVFSFPSFVMTLLQKAERLGYDVRRDLNLKYVPGGGERHIQTLRKVFEEQYGLTVGDGYGTSDVGQVAYDCGLGEGYHYDDEVCVIEIVDPHTGKHVGPLEIGEVVVTLFSRVYPLVRFGTGDLASFDSESCRCGRAAPRITGITGMIGDHIRVKGMFVHRRELEEAMSGFPGITNYQMVLGLQGHRDRITLKIEGPTIGLNQELLEALNKRCQDVFKLRMDEISLLQHGTLPSGCVRFVDDRWKASSQ